RDRRDVTTCVPRRNWVRPKFTASFCIRFKSKNSPTAPIVRFWPPSSCRRTCRLVALLAPSHFHKYVDPPLGFSNVVYWDPRFPPPSLRIRRDNRRIRRPTITTLSGIAWKRFAFLGEPSPFIATK